MNKMDVDVFVKQLKHRDPDVRFDAVKALEMAGGDNVLPHIISALEDKDSSVAFMAEQALVRLGGSKAEIALADYNQKNASTIKPQGKIGEPVVIALSGVTFEGRLRALAQAHSDEIVNLIRRPDNVHDHKAIECLRQNGDSLGWLPKETSREYSVYMDQGYRLHGRILSILNGYGNKPIMGARVVIGWSEADVAPLPSGSQNNPLSRSKNSEERYFDENYRDDDTNRFQDMRDDGGYDDHNYDRED